MKKNSIIFMIIVFLLFSQTSSQQEQYQLDDDSLNETLQSETPYTTAMKIWLKDSEVLRPIVTSLQKYKVDFNDTKIIREEKERMRAKMLVEVNNKYKNKPLVLQRVRVVDVEEEKILSKYGKQKANNVINELKKHPEGKFILEMGTDVEKNFILRLYVAMALAFCDKCYIPTGKYIAEYEIPIPSEYSNEIYNKFSSGIFIGDTEKVTFKTDTYSTQTCKVKIYKKLSNKNEALSIEKNAILPLNGVIENIVYNGNIGDIRIYIR